MRSLDERGGYDDFAAASVGRLLRMAYLLTGSTHDAADLTQDTLERLFVSWWRIKADPMAYAFKTMVNLAHNRRRWRRRHVETALDLVAEPADDDRSDQILSRAEIVSALQQLPPRQRAVIVLRYLEDLPEAHTAAALNISPGTVKSQSAKALTRLRQILVAVDAATDFAGDGGVA